MGAARTRARAESSASQKFSFSTAGHVCSREHELHARRAATRLIQHQWRRHMWLREWAADRIPYQRAIRRMHKHPLYVLCVLRLAEVLNFVALVVELQIDRKRHKSHTWDMIELTYLCVVLLHLLSEYYARYAQREPNSQSADLAQPSGQEIDSSPLAAGTPT